jgi:methionine synthase I (cobalamin-dependent)
MNTKLNLNTFEEIHAAYEDTILSDDDTKVDPVLMEGYIDNLEANSKALQKATEAEKKKDGHNTFMVDLKAHAIFFGSCAGTVFLGHKIMTIYDWLAAMI